MNERLDNRIALVTGGSRGIGRACCEALAAKGASVAIHCRTRIDLAEAVARQIEVSGGEAMAFQADLVDPDAPNALVQAVLAKYGKIDILINNAGEMTDGAVIDLSDATWDQMLNVNLSAVFRLTRACLPSMVGQQWGRVINLTSQAAYTGSANHAHYAAAKAGLSGFSYSLAKEVGPSGITVNLVSPGRILTDMLQERMTGREEEWMKQTPLRRFGHPEEVAALVAFLATDAAGYITGATLHINGGMLMS